MTFQTFLETYNGKRNVGNTTENKGECVGLSMVWVNELGLPHIWGHAKDLLANADEKFFEKILNTPDAVPKEGDIIVWGKSFNGTYGHTGIATSKGDVNTFECFEQNDPVGSNCHLKTYNYKAVIGWLRPSQKFVQTDNIILQQSDAFIALCAKMNVPANKDLALAELDKLIKVEDALRQKDDDLRLKEEEIQKMKVEAENILSELKSVRQENEEAQKAIGDLKQVVAEYEKRADEQEDIMRRLGDRIEVLKKVNPVEAYGWLDLIVLGVKRLFGR